MSRKTKFHLTFSLGVLAAAAVISWLVAGETSPLNEYFSDSVLLNFWRGLHFIPFLASVAAAGGHAANDFVFITACVVQWLVIGLILSFVVLRFRHRPSETPPSIFK